MSDKKLSMLLSMKRLEEPSEERWAAFDVAFRNRQLTEMNCPKQRWWCSWKIGEGLGYKRLVGALGICCVCGIIGAKVLLNMSHSNKESVTMACQTSRDYIQFVNDKMLSCAIDEASHEEVYRMNSEPINYVCDMLVPKKDVTLMARL